MTVYKARVIFYGFGFTRICFEVPEMFVVRVFIAIFQ